MNLFTIALVAAGGALGSVCRYLVGVGAGRFLGLAFPWGTMIVNVLGSLTMGIFAGLLALVLDGSTPLRLFVAVGFLGGFTTLSSFSLDTVMLWERGAHIAAGGYAMGTVVLSVIALSVGLMIVRGIA